MKQNFTDAEFRVVAKLHCKKHLTLKDYFTLASMYKRHGAASVVMAIRNASGKLPHSNTRLTAIVKKVCKRR